MIKKPILTKESIGQEFDVCQRNKEFPIFKMVIEGKTDDNQWFLARDRKTDRSLLFDMHGKINSHFEIFSEFYIKV